MKIIDILLSPIIRIIEYCNISPNNITIFRLVGSLFFHITVTLYFFFDHSGSNKTLWLIILFNVLVVSDYLDGYLARRNKLVSDYGARIDAFADKVLTIPIELCIYYFFIKSKYEILAFVSIFFILSNLGGIYFRFRNSNFIKLHSTPYAKIKFFGEAIFINFVMLLLNIKGM